MCSERSRHRARRRWPISTPRGCTTSFNDRAERRICLRPTSALRRALMREMQDLRRYLSDQEQAACERLFALVRRKDDLDFHEARQKLLKLWLFVHIGLTYALVLLALLHGLVGARVSRRWRVREPAPDYSSELLRAAESAVGVRPGQRRPCVPGRADRRRPVPCPGRMRAGARRRSLAMQSFGTARRGVRRRPDAGGRLRPRASLPAGAKLAADSRSICHRYGIACWRRTASFPERGLARRGDRTGAAGFAARAIVQSWPGNGQLCGVSRGGRAKRRRLDGVAGRWASRTSGAVATVHGLPRHDDLACGGARGA